MSRQKVKARGRMTQKMTKDGLAERNEATGASQSVSERSAEIDLRNASPEGDIQDAGINPARKGRQSYSQVGNKSEGTENPTAKRNKAVYRNHQARQQEAKNPVQLAEPVNSGLPDNLQNDKSDTQPNHANQALHAHEPVDIPKPSIPKTPHETASGESQPSTEQGGTRLKTRDSAQPLNFHSKSTDKPQSGEGILKELRSASLRHDKQSALQNIVARSLLKNKPPAAPVLRHKKEKPNDAASGQPENTDASDGIAQNPANESAQNPEAPPQTKSRQTSSQVGNKKKGPRNKLQSKQTSTVETAANTAGAIIADALPEPDATHVTEAENPQSKNDSMDSSLQHDKDGKLQPDRGSKLNFTPDEVALAAPAPKSRKLAKAEKGVERATAKLDKAKDKLPAKTKIRSRLVFDEEKGRPKKELFLDKQVKTQAEHLKGPLPLRPFKAGANSALNFAHGKIFQIEHENVEIKAAHRGEMAAEGGIRGTLQHMKARKYRRVAKLEHRLMKKNVNLAYRQALEKNPKLKSNVFSRMWQKRKIRKEYAKAASDAKKAAGGIKKAGSMTVRAANYVTKAVIKNPKVLAFLLVAGMVAAMLMTILSLFMSFGGSGMGGIFSAVYLAEDEDIDEAALAYSEWETDLLLQIQNVESSHPGFDEYVKVIGDIGHDPLALMAFLTATFHIFTFADIEEELRALFDEQYNLTFTPSMEIRTRMEQSEYYPYDYEEVEYEWHILTVTLESVPFMDLIMSRMDAEQALHFQVLMETGGARHHVGSPFPFNWHPFISSHVYKGYFNPQPLSVKTQNSLWGFASLCACGFNMPL